MIFLFLFFSTLQTRSPGTNPSNELLCKPSRHVRYKLQSRDDLATTVPLSKCIQTVRFRLRANRLFSNVMEKKKKIAALAIFVKNGDKKKKTRSSCNSWVFDFEIGVSSGFDPPGSYLRKWNTRVLASMLHNAACQIFEG